MPWGCSSWQVYCTENPAPEAKNATVYYYIKNSINLIQVYNSAKYVSWFSSIFQAGERKNIQFMLEEVGHLSVNFL